MSTAERTHAGFVPLLWLVASAGYFWVVITFSEGSSGYWKTTAQIWGTAAVYCLIPSYVWICNPYLWRRTAHALGELAESFVAPQHWVDRVLYPPRGFVFSWIALGGLYGMSQNTLLILNIQESANIWLDISMIIINTIVWMSLGSLLGRRLYAGSGLCLAGYQVHVDLYNLVSLRPFARVALLDVLVVMGAVAIMPIQALDFEFRWENYEAGLIIGIPSAITFFLLPIWGVHRSTRKTRGVRVQEIQKAVDACARNDIVRLDSLVAHRDRVQSLPTWPLDLRLLTRAAFYLVIPPLAWVGAALVENLVENML